MKFGPLRSVSAPVLAASVLVGGAAGQVQTELMFSIDFQGPLMGALSAGGTAAPPITDADVFRRSSGQFAPGVPRTVRPGSFLGAYSLCAGHLPGDPCGLEINAISGGRDARLMASPLYRFTLYLSVDEFAVGTPTPPLTPGASIFSEALRQEAAADVFARTFTGQGPFQLVPGNAVGVADGNGDRSAPGQPAFLGLGLVEPIAPTSGSPDNGSNLDAIDIGPLPDPLVDPLYFSLQAGFPHCNEPNTPVFNAASNQILPSGAAAQGADVLVYDPTTGTVAPYADALRLGLDRSGPGTDDVDALVVVENGIPGFQPPTALYSWVGPSATDLVLYSLRCGSATIGRPDDNFGVPITQGDVLLYIDGAQTPGIFIAAESLGLETVSRGGMFDDELDGLDLVDDLEDPFKDCNMNGVEDNIDIYNGTSDDCDVNGIPDECEDDWTVYCTCELTANSPCGNTAGAGEGCRNVSGTGGALNGMGTTSVFSDFLQLSVSGVNPNTFALVFTGDANSPGFVGNGRRCVAPGAQGIFRLTVQPTGASGSFVYGPGILANAGTITPTAPMIMIGATWGFQAYYRDIGGPCPLTPDGNMTNALSVTFTL